MQWWVDASQAATIAVLLLIALYQWRKGEALTRALCEHIARTITPVDGWTAEDFARAAREYETDTRGHKLVVLEDEEWPVTVNVAEQKQEQQQEHQNKDRAFEEEETEWMDAPGGTPQPTLLDQMKAGEGQKGQAG